MVLEIKITVLIILELLWSVGVAVYISIACHAIDHGFESRTDRGRMVQSSLNKVPSILSWRKWLVGKVLLLTEVIRM